MEFNDIATMIGNLGVSVAVIAYFLFKDYKFSSQLERTLQELKDTVQVLSDFVRGGEGE